MKADAINTATSWCLRHGWKAMLIPAKAGKGEGSSGGVGILVRDYLGLHEPLWGSGRVDGRSGHERYGASPWGAFDPGVLGLLV